MQQSGSGGIRGMLSILKNKRILTMLIASIFVIWFIYWSLIGGKGKVIFKKGANGRQREMEGGDEPQRQRNSLDSSTYGDNVALPEKTTEKPAVLRKKPSKLPKTKVNTDNSDKEKQQFIKNMMRHAWKGYRDFAFGADELKPISKSSRNWMSGSGLAATLIDSLDTLKIMGMETEFKEAVDWAVTKVNFDQNTQVSFFETTIRIVGGLLSAYHLDGERDQRLLDKAKDMADRLLPAFNTPNGMPRPKVNLKEGKGYSGWAGGKYLLAEVGTCQLELSYLSDLTNEPKYGEKAENVIEFMSKMKTTVPGLFPSYLDEGIEQSNQEYTFGGLADSFYEYLLKMWLFTGKTNNLYQKLYDQSITAALDKLVGKNSDGQVFVGVYSYGDLRPEMEHLTCFAGGMLALGHATKSSTDPKVMEIAKGITQTCYLMYQKQKLGLSPEKVRMSDLQANDGGSSYYIQRPEAIESLFYLWRLTKDQKYRDWGWEIVQSIEKYTRVEHGYSGINNINQDPISLNDNQESFFLAETLKYLYLLFSDDSVIPLDDYVFNTEAHPIPIRKANQ